MRRTLFALLVLSGTAHAGPGKSRNLALALGGVGTGVSASLAVASVIMAPSSGDVVNKPMFATALATSIITPSLGQFYAGDYLTIGMAIRAGSVALAGVAVLGMSESHRCNLDQQCENLTQQGVVIAGMAAIAFIGGAAWDISETTDAVDAYNRKHGIYVGAVSAIDHATVPTVGLGGTF